MNAPAPRAPERWALAERRDIEALKLLRGKDDLTGQFFLGLALGFNDLKGLIMFELYLDAMGAPTDQTLTPYFGQWHGARAQMHRWMVGVLHEILNVIGATRYRTVRMGNELASLVSELTADSRQAWTELVTVATSTNDSTNSLLARIRNTTAFHYGNKGPALANAYSDFFGRPEAARLAGTNQHAMYSVGVNMDGTRFYYADAAALHEVHSQLSSKAKTMDDVFALTQKVNEALASLLALFIEARSAS